LGADGTAYGFSNVRGAKTVNGLLTDAHSRFHEHKPPKVDIVVDKPKQFANSPEPSATDVIRVFTRVRPVPLAANSLNKGVGRDHLWILGSDLKKIAAAAASGSAFQMPQDLRMRIARFHLLDNVRGQPDPWLVSEVKKASIRMTPVGRRGGDMIYKLEGSFAMRNSSGDRGLEGSLTGELEIDVARNRVSWLRMIADGTAWGESKFTAHGPVGKYPLMIAMMNVDDTLSRTVDPDGASLGDQYFHPIKVK
jgi:hypothetical protein